MFFVLALSMRLLAGQCWIQLDSMNIGRTLPVKKFIEHRLGGLVEGDNKRTVVPLPGQTKVHIVSKSDKTTVYLFTVYDVANVAVSGGLTGSAGPLVMILEQVGKDVRSLYEGNLIEVYGASGRGARPSIYVMVHGSEFNRAGSDYVLTRLEYGDKEGLYLLSRREVGPTIRACD